MGNTPHRRSSSSSSYFSGCISPSCVQSYNQYTLINDGKHNNGCDRWRRKWRKLINTVIRESKKSIYGSPKPLTFRYDAVSYSQNFDEGTHRCEYYDQHGRRCSIAHRWFDISIIMHVKVSEIGFCTEKSVCVCVRENWFEQD